MLNFCIVGVGSIGRRHLRLLSERNDVKLSVVEPFEPSWERVCREIGEFPRYRSLEEALEKGKPDAVIIATPHGMHADMAIQSLQAGVHVFCEKPMSDSLEECVAMLNAAQKSDRVFSVGFMFHFDPFVQKVKSLLDEGRIGNILHYSSRFATYMTLLCSITQHQAHTPFSVAMDCIHDTDLLCWLTGRVPDYCFCNHIQAGDLERTSPPNILDTVYRWQSKELAAHTHFNYVQYPQVHTLEIVGDRGFIQGDFMEPAILIGSDNHTERITMKRDFDDVYRAEWDHFIRAVRGEVAPENPASSAILSTLLMQAQIESGRSGEEVSIRQIADRYGFSY